MSTLDQRLKCEEPDVGELADRLVTDGFGFMAARIRSRKIAVVKTVDWFDLGRMLSHVVDLEEIHSFHLDEGSGVDQDGDE